MSATGNFGFLTKTDMNCSKRHRLPRGTLASSTILSKKESVRADAAKCMSSPHILRSLAWDTKRPFGILLRSLFFLNCRRAHFLVFRNEKSSPVAFLGLEIFNIWLKGFSVAIDPGAFDHVEDIALVQLLAKI